MCVVQAGAGAVLWMGVLLLVLFYGWECCGRGLFCVFRNTQRSRGRILPRGIGVGVGSNGGFSLVNQAGREPPKYLEGVAAAAVDRDARKMECARAPRARSRIISA